jgi:hypothetical protein
MGKETLTWKDFVADALRELGGQAHLSQINEKVKNHPKTKTNPTWKETIRRVVRQYRIFEPVPPERSGVYRLVEVESVSPKSQNLDSSDVEINHGIAQGMLVTLGNVYGYETFVPTHDQTVREFQGTKIGEMVTVKDCTEVFKGPNLTRVREIDVLWFDEDDYGLYPVYAKVKDGLDRLLKIPRRFGASLFIVGPGEAELDLFNRYLTQTPFRDYRDRFRFRLYDQLQVVYNTAIQHAAQRADFGVVERRKRI